MSHELKLNEDGKEEFLSESLLFPYVNKSVKPINFQNKYIFYTYSNFLLCFDVSINKFKKVKISKNEIVFIELYNNKIYILSKSTELNPSQFVEFSLKTFSISNSYDMNKTLKYISFEINNEQIYFLTSSTIEIFSLDKMGLFKSIEIRLIEERVFPINFISIKTKNSNIMIINYFKFLLAVDLQTGKELKIKDSSLNK